MKKLYGVLIALLFITLATGFWAKTKLEQAGQAYIYGYPLLLVEATKNEMLSVGGSTINKFRHNHIFPDHSFRSVVRPNNDTLYSIAWLDLTQEPLILSTPDTSGRYYVMPFMDAYTNVFAAIGKRTTGTQPGKFLISGPAWNEHGAVPLNIKHIQAPTNSVWLIGRIQTNGVEDISQVSTLQNKFLLTPLSGLSTKTDDTGDSESIAQHASNVEPSAEVDKLSLNEFLGRLGQLLTTTEVPDQDLDALSNLAKLGVDPDLGFDSEANNSLERWLFQKGFAIAKQRLAEQIDKREFTENGWVVYREGLGNYGINYALRAGVAKIGLGALPPEEAAYPNAKVDAENRPLTGEHSYTLHFDAQQSPPVDAFWSLAMYDSAGFFIKSPINRYSISDRDDLNFNADGSLTILIQHQQPSSNATNWLPSPQGEFSLTLRLYLPSKEFLNGSWVLPPVVRVK